MKNLLNFSHPLSPQARQQLTDWAGDECKEIVVPCQIDFELSLDRQLEALAIHTQNVVDFYIPPALSAVAAYVTACMLDAGHRPLMPVLKRAGLPPVFVLAEVVQL